MFITDLGIKKLFDEANLLLRFGGFQLAICKAQQKRANEKISFVRNNFTMILIYSDIFDVLQ